MELELCEQFGIPHSEFLSWDEEDQDKALAYKSLKAETCSRCGTREEEWTVSRFAYEADVNRCRGCEIIEMTQEAVSEEKNTHGIRIGLRPAEVPEHLPEHVRKRFTKGLT